VFDTEEIIQQQANFLSKLQNLFQVQAQVMQRLTPPRPVALNPVRRHYNNK